MLPFPLLANVDMFQSFLQRDPSTQVFRRVYLLLPPKVSNALRCYSTVKGSSHDPILIQLTLKIFVCVMEFVGIHRIQFLHPIIS